MAKIKRDKLKATAEELFIEQGMTCKRIAELIGVTEATLSKWRNNEDWDMRRAENVSAPHKIKSILLSEMLKISEGKKSAVDSDKLVKVSASLERIDKRTSVPVIISVLIELDNFVADIDPVKAAEFTDWHKQFILYKAKQES